MKRPLRLVFTGSASAFFRGNLKTKLIFLFSVACSLFLVGACVAYFLFQMPLADACWWSWTHILDPGFLTDDHDIWSRRIVGSIFTILGLIIIGGAFIALAEEAACWAFDAIMKGRLPFNLENHTVLAGTGQKLRSFVSALNAIENQRTRRDFVVVIPEIGLFDETKKICGPNCIIKVEHIWEAKAQEALKLEKAKRILILDNYGKDYGAMLKIVVETADKRETCCPGNELKFYIEVNDRNIVPALQASIASLRGDKANMEVNIINMANASARLALQRHPLDCKPLQGASQGQVALLVIGWSSFADASFWQAVRVAHYPSKPTKIMIVDPSVEEIKKRIFAEAPGLQESDYAKSLLALEFYDSRPAVYKQLTENQLLTVAICGNNADDVFARGIYLHESPLPGQCQIILDLPDGSGYRDIVKKFSNAQLYAEGSHADAFELTEALDAQATKLHEIYLEQRTKSNKLNPEINKADRPWKVLDEVRRGWNRTPADHTDIKLRALADAHGVGRHYRTEEGKIVLQPELQKLVSTVITTPTGVLNSDLELLASIEHDRWSAEKFAEGWRHGDTKDDKKKRSPYLVFYEKLTEEIKGYDREMVINCFKLFA